MESKASRIGVGRVEGGTMEESNDNSTDSYKYNLISIIMEADRNGCGCEDQHGMAEKALDWVEKADWGL